MLTYLEIARRYRPRWIVWENVPGVLSSNGGRDFGSFLGALGELGYGFAYRVLDAQWFGVAQRRRRVFVVGYLGDWRRAAAVLFKSESVCRDTPPSRETREETSRDTASSIDELQPYRVANCLTQRMYKGINTTLDEGQTPVIAFHNRQDPDVSGTITHPIGAKDNGLAVAYPVHYRK
jgi:site-specific DNA-cytosine methylase